MFRHLRNIALLLHVQRPSRHKNCRVGGLMCGNQHTEIQLQTVFYLGFSMCSSTYPWKKNIFYQRTNLIIMHYIALLAKIGNCCSMVWARRQGQWKGKNSSLSFVEEAAKKLCVVLQCILDMIFYARILQ